MKNLLLVLCIVLFLTACGPSPEQQAAMTATAITATAASWTLTPTPTVTPTSILTPTPTNTPLPTLTATPTRTATSTPSPTSTQDPNRFYTSDGKFSMILPEGWTTADVGTKYPIILSEGIDQDGSNIIFITDTVSLPAAMYAAFVQDSLAGNLTDLTTISEEYPTTAAGDEYFRWEMQFTQNGVPIHGVMYFLENGDWKLVINYTRLQNQGAKNDELVDAAVNSIQFNP